MLYQMIVFAILAACATAPVTERRQFNFIPNSQMEQMGMQAFQEVKAKEKISHDPYLNEMVRRIGNRIAEASKRDFQWEFVVISQPKTVNAFCLPGGKVAVYTGILPYAKTEAGLAAVLGHEIAHATAGHGGERMSQALAVQAGLMATDFALADKKSKNLILGAMGAGAQFGVLLPFSRTQESEADRIGVAYMAKAGYDPRAAPGIWERMSSSGDKQPPEFMSTHPSHETRIQKISKDAEDFMSDYEKSDKQPDRPIRLDNL